MTQRPRPRILGVVLHHKGWPTVSGCLTDLQAQTSPPQDVVVVDNASGDGSVEAIRAAFPSVTVLPLDRNDGYAAGMNAALRSVHLTDYDHVLLCTQDARLEPDCVQRLVATLAVDDTIAAAGPLLGWASRPDVVWSAGGTLHPVTGRPAHRRPGGALADVRGDGTTDVAWIDGALMLLRVDALAAVGLLDERFFLYSEEVEWLLRAQDLGWRVVVVPSAVGWQEPGQAPPYLETRNRIQLYRLRGTRRRVAFAVGAGLREAASAARRREWAMAALRLRATRDGLSGRLDRRRALQR